jgi:hypothetical protein
MENTEDRQPPYLSFVRGGHELAWIELEAFRRGAAQVARGSHLTDFGASTLATSEQEPANLAPRTCP